MKELRQEDSKVEVSGFEAKYYDTLMNVITLGWYPSFIRKVIADLKLKRGDKVLDFGAGTGRNALLMREYVGEEGRIVGLEIGEEMQRQFLRNTGKYPNILMENRRIDEALPYENAFDMVFISFVLHGFIQEKRDAIIANAVRALRPGGIFAVLDYNNFDVGSAPAWIRFAIRKVECPLAEDFIRRDTREMLETHGLGEFAQTEYMKGYIRLLQGKKR